VVYLQDPPKWAADYTMEEHLKVLAKPYPEGFSLTPARVREALFRADKLKDAAHLLDDGKSGDAAKEQGEGAEFADEEDQELTKLKEKLVSCLLSLVYVCQVTWVRTHAEGASSCDTRISSAWYLSFALITSRLGMGWRPYRGLVLVCINAPSIHRCLNPQKVHGELVVRHAACACRSCFREMNACYRT
jgi:hypothetical protein